MILAAIIFVSIFCSAPSSVQASDFSISSAAQSNSSPASQDSTQNTNSTSSPAQVPAEKAKPAAPLHHHRQKIPIAASNCPSSVPAGTSAAKNSQTSASKAMAGTGKAPTNCPPPKVVVRNGGTSDPPVQITGGESDDQASHERATTDQLLASTDENLKKLDDHSLTSSQQEMVSQIQQFMEQAKTADAAGELERGRNLAMKAHLLSDELAKP